MSDTFDPTTLEIYRALYTSVAEEMGIALRRTAFSPNIKERRDYSCAVFDPDSRVIAQGDHMPVHLGSMPMAVAAALREVELGPGDVVALNDPFAGGTHLPDVTLVMGVFGATRGHGDGVTGGYGDAGTGGHGGGVTRGHGDAVTGRRGDGETRGYGDVGTGGHGDAGTGGHGDAGTGGHGDAGTGRHGDVVTGGHGDAGTGRHGDAGTGRHGDAGTGRHGDAGTGRHGRVSPSPRLRVPVSQSHRVPPSPHPPFPASQTPLFYVANRAHHADIGGATPGSMGLSTDVYGEGVRIPPVRIMHGGELDEEMMRLILANVRGHEERRGDFRAQIGALRTGSTRLLEIVERRGAKEATEYAGHLIKYSARLMRHAIAAIPDGDYRAEDVLDDDGITKNEIPIRVNITIKGQRARIDFSGSAPQVAGPINAVEAITVSAVSYVFRCLLAGDVPASAGLMEPIEVIAPHGTVVNARHPASVAGGNVETSQRIVDVVFKALTQALPDRMPAASQGTMNNLTIGGIDTRTDLEFSYYETIAGGMGARPHLDGISAVHTHMTNSLNTPAEALEYSYPLRVREYKIRKASGGKGKQKGGDGVIREIETLVPARISLLADRREHRPYGLQGGEPGKPGRNSIIRDGRAQAIASKGSWELKAGDRVRIETPGGGGFGSYSANCYD